ncbi:hypothetical protein AKJ09_03962 [Labilithrix luteola]|uniref:Outer membrane protein beta-barrel domain-containing protein n=1 Tax=Labilithrix luteola TaxID=1391654 RepID=A0A0K1PUU2_9BACT|nr:hypothetical protein [Labilithrix luteola]AKU97298.1 hypothetical protein AKJ09_03962 [Labilithrix luteola]
MDTPIAIEAPAPKSGWFADVSAGPAFATYGAIDDAGISEHLATGGSAVALGAGYGFDLLPFRLDLGVRVQHYRFGVRGSYNAEKRDDSFRATYDYVFPTLTATITTKLRSRVNVLGGVSLGTATFISDPQGGSVHARQLPVYGTFEAGLELTATEWLAVRAVVAWLPPFEALNVVSPTLGLRARF